MVSPASLWLLGFSHDFPPGHPTFHSHWKLGDEDKQTEKRQLSSLRGSRFSGPTNPSEPPQHNTLPIPIIYRQHDESFSLTRVSRKQKATPDPQIYRFLFLYMKVSNVLMKTIKMPIVSTTFIRKWRFSICTTDLGTQETFGIYWLDWGYNLEKSKNIEVPSFILLSEFQLYPFLLNVSRLH